MATATRSRPLTDEEYAALTREQRIALGLEDATEGAPADFGGTVLPNPNHIRPLADTDPGTEPTRLPNGIQFQHGNFSGKIGADVSNPAKAELISPEMQTIAAKTTGQPVSTGAQIDYDALAKQHGATASEIDYDALAKQHGAVTSETGEAKPAEHEGFLMHAVKTAGSDLYGMAKGAAGTAVGLTPGADLIPKAVRDEYGIRTPLDSVKDTVKNASEQWKRETEAKRSTPYKVAAQAGPLVGLNVEGMEKSADEGDVAGVVGHAAAPLAVVAATEGARLAAKSPAVQAKVQAIRDAGSNMRVSAKSASAQLGKAATTVGKSLDPDIVGLVSPRGAHALRLSQKVGKVATKLGKEAPAAAETTPAKLPAAFDPLPPKPPALPGTVENPFRAAEEAPAAAETTPAAKTPAPKVTPKAVSEQLETSLGGQKLVPGVPLRAQPAAMRAAAGKLPEGFTPVESSAIKGFHYDPATREFSSVTHNGQHYIHGDVSLEEVQAFSEAESKGKAWNQLRSQNPLVGKVVNGQRIASAPPKPMRSVVFDPETGKPEFSDVVAKKAAAKPAAARLRESADKLSSGEDTTPSSNKAIYNGSTYEYKGGQFLKDGKVLETGEDIANAVDALEAPRGKVIEGQVSSPKKLSTAAASGEDLTPQLQASLDQVNLTKGAVRTNVDPALLAKRWGVDLESLKSGREQTRGMAAQETEADVQKLTAAYKKGQPVTPVIETRDAANNIVSVDGRARAIAAQRAGVKRIPVIVRRLGKTKAAD